MRQHLEEEELSQTNNFLAKDLKDLGENERGNKKCALDSFGGGCDERSGENEKGNKKWVLD